MGAVLFLVTSGSMASVLRMGGAKTGALVRHSGSKLGSVTVDRGGENHRYDRLGLAAKHKLSFFWKEEILFCVRN